MRLIQDTQHETTSGGIRGSNNQFQTENAFTLLEVMIAITLFFMATFAILDLVGQGVRAAHSLNQMGPTAGMVAAEISMNQKLEEGSGTGDFGELYRDYSYSTNVSIVTNGLFLVEITLFHGRNEDSHLSFYLYSAESDQQGGGGKKFSGKKGKDGG